MSRSAESKSWEAKDKVKEIWDAMKLEAGLDVLKAIFNDEQNDGKVSLTAQNDKGNNLFHYLAHNTQVKIDDKIIKWMLQKLKEGALEKNSLFALNHNEMTPLEVALSRQNLVFISQLQDYDLLQGTTPARLKILSQQGKIKAYNNEALLRFVALQIGRPDLSLQDDEKSAPVSEDYFKILQTILNHNGKESFDEIAISTLPQHSEVIKSWASKRRNESAASTASSSVVANSSAASKAVMTQPIEKQLENLILKLEAAVMRKDRDFVNREISSITEMHKQINHFLPQLLSYKVQGSNNIFQYAFRIADYRILWELLAGCGSRIMSTMQGLSPQENLDLLKNTDGHYLQALKINKNANNNAHNFTLALLNNLDADGFIDLLETGDFILEADHTALWKVVADKIRQAFHNKEVASQQASSRDPSDMDLYHDAKRDYSRYYQVLQIIMSNNKDAEAKINIARTIKAILPEAAFNTLLLQFITPIITPVQETLLNDIRDSNVGVALEKLKKLLNWFGDDITSKTLNIALNPAIADNVVLCDIIRGKLKSNKTCTELGLHGALGPNIICSAMQGLSSPESTLVKMCFSNNGAAIINKYHDVDVEINTEGASAGRVESLGEGQMIISTITNMLRTNCNLQHLAFQNCRLENKQASDMVSAIIAAIKQNPRASTFTLDLNGNNIDPDTKAQILQQVSETPGMKITINDNIENGVAAAIAAEKPAATEGDLAAGAQATPNPEFQNQSFSPVAAALNLHQQN